MVVVVVVVVVVLTFIISSLLEELSTIKKECAWYDCHEIGDDANDESLIEKLVAIVQLHASPLLLDRTFAQARVLDDPQHQGGIPKGVDGHQSVNLQTITTGFVEFALG